MRRPLQVLCTLFWAPILTSGTITLPAIEAHHDAGHSWLFVSAKRASTERFHRRAQDLIIIHSPGTSQGLLTPTMTTTNYITQTLLPRSTGFPPQLHIRHISLRHAGDALRHLTYSLPEANNSRTVRAIGIAYHISQRGALAFIALANDRIVIRVDFPENEKSPHVDSALAHLLGSGEVSLTAVDDGRPRLVGFGLARTAVRLQQKLRSRIRGVDVAKLDASTEKDLAPAEVAQQLLSRNVDEWEVTRLWLGNENTAERNVCLQAWLAAW